ncbi:ABC transporter permease [Taibaiella soli]|uniref:ABC transporter permease n=1 Tax=Taibaiella soli TaxID=1649169 RepID=A0A2W2B2I0_9BACT|nr:ABC transporter permease [Taibaiella soli]PZF74484.1 ABC transporter permease [Taibaiella soli]
MRQLLAFIRKEFAHVFRDRKTLLMLFGLPVAQIILFGFALSNEIKNVKIVVVDNAKDIASQEITQKIAASQYFQLQKTFDDAHKIEQAFKEGKIKAAVVFPVNFYSELTHLNKAQIQIIADASDPNTATTVTNYLTSIIYDYQTQQAQNGQVPYQINAETTMLYNPQLKSAPNFVPGVMALVLMLVCVMMTSVAIVREKELGTMEVLLVSPFKPIMVIIAKAIPYLILSFVNVITILLLSVFLLDLPIKGNLLLLLGESMLFIMTSLSVGLLISTKTSSQQTAMMISLVGMMLPTILFSGFMFPIENLPKVFQWISNIIPAKWYYIIARSVMIKGLGFQSIWKETLVLIGMTVVLLGVSLKSFKKRLE